LNTLFVLTLACLFSACSSQQAKKDNKTANKISIKKSWVRPANQGTNSAAYLTITNGTAQADTLLNVASTAADMVGVHETYRNEQGMTGMKEAETIIIQPDSSLILEPGGYHIMLMDLEKTLQEGDSVQIFFNFAVSGEKRI